MRASSWWMWVTALVVSGCNCDPKGEPDASVPLTLSWPPGARIEITATTATSADLAWPEAVGPVAHYRLSWPRSSRDEAGTTATLSSLTPGQHLPLEV